MDTWNIKEKIGTKYIYYQLVNTKKQVLYGVSLKDTPKTKIIIENKNNNINPGKLLPNEICISTEGVNITEEIKDILNSLNKLLLDKYSTSITGTPPVELLFYVDSIEEEEQINGIIGKYNINYKIKNRSNTNRELLNLSKEKQELLDKWNKIPEISAKISRLSNRKLDELLTKALNNEKSKIAEQNISKPEIEKQPEEPIKNEEIAPKENNIVTNEIALEKTTPIIKQEAKFEEKKSITNTSERKFNTREDTKIFLKPDTSFYDDASILEEKDRKISLPLIIFIISLILLIISGIILFLMK